MDITAQTAGEHCKSGMQRHLLLILALLPAALGLAAQTLKEILSKNSDIQVALGAHPFPNHAKVNRIRLRTQGELAQGSEAKVTTLWANSEAAFLTSVYKHLPKQQPTVIAGNPEAGAARLNRLQRERTGTELAEALP